MLGHHEILGHVHQTTGEVTRVCRLQRRIREALPSPVGGDEVLVHGQAFPEVCRDRGLNDGTIRAGHQPPHPRQLTDLRREPRAPESAYM